MTPATEEILAKELLRLRVVTASREKSGVDLELMAAAYIDDMRKYPADIAAKVIRKRRQWWPTLAELSDDADKLLATRKLLHKHFSGIHCGPVQAAMAVVSAERGERKLPFDWKERSGMRSQSVREAAPGPLEWEPDMSPVSVSQSLASSIGA